QNDHPETAKLLIEKGAKNGKNQVLNYAVNKNHPDVVKAVLDSGPVDAKALTSALRRATTAKRTEIIEMLTKAGAVIPAEFAVDVETLNSYAGAYKPVADGP